MNKTTEKILLAPINALVWISHNPSETILGSIFAFSVCPLIGIHIGSTGFLGGLLGFLAVMSQKYIFKYEKTTTTFNILSIILLLIGIVSFFIVGDKKTLENWSNVELSINTYFGAFFGMMVSFFFISFIDSEKAARDERRKENERVALVMRKNKEIAKKESEGFVAIRGKDYNLVGYVEKEKYDDFVNQNLIKDESK